MAELFTADHAVDPEKDYYPELVGEDKKFKDNTALARGKVEADIHIEKLQAELAELREKAETTTTLAEAVQKIREDQEAWLKSVRENQDLPDRTPTDTEKESMSIEDVEQLLDRRMSEREKEAVASQNLKNVMETAEEILGVNYRQELDRRRQELGLGSEFLTDLAKTQPKAFLKLLDVRKNNEAELFTPPANQRNTSSNPSGGRRNYEYYAKIRQENPAEYDRLRVQMTKDAMEQGDAFYS